jgi:protein-glutamine gamma-glutamyltransferase
VDISYAYFVLCLFAASFHSKEDRSFYWGLCVLLAWALWPYRSRRFSVATWAGVLSVSVLLGYGGHGRVWRIYRLIEMYNARWFVRQLGGGTDFRQSRTAFGHIGRLKQSHKIVIRLEPKDGSRAPALLREASYRTWKGQNWYSEQGIDKFESVFESADHSTWTLLPGKTNGAVVNIACSLPDQGGLLPLPTGTTQLEKLSAWVLQKSGLGMVLAEGPGLVIFDALYEPGPTIDSPPDGKLDLSVSPREIPALDQVIQELHLKGQNWRQVLQTLSGFFQDTDKFSYSTWEGTEPVRGTNATALARFLLRTRRGHCEYFATATVLLLRELGIPARYAVGYAVHEGSGRQYVVRQRDAHAWCLVWNDTAQTWQDFDTTPASWEAIEASGVSPMQFLLDGWSRLMFELAKLRWGQSHLREYVLWGLGPILALLLYQIIVRSRKRRRLPKPDESRRAISWPGLDSEFYQVERRLAGRGMARQGGEPLSAWLMRAVADPALGDVRERLRGLLSLHYRYRFDPEGLSQGDRENLRREAAACLARME